MYDFHDYGPAEFGTDERHELTHTSAVTTDRQADQWARAWDKALANRRAGETPRDALRRAGLQS